MAAICRMVVLMGATLPICTTAAPGKDGWSGKAGGPSRAAGLGLNNPDSSLEQLHICCLLHICCESDKDCELELLAATYMGRGPRAHNTQVLSISLYRTRILVLSASASTGE
mgnify:CR=1 FL=1